MIRCLIKIALVFLLSIALLLFVVLLDSLFYGGIDAIEFIYQNCPKFLGVFLVFIYVFFATLIFKIKPMSKKIHKAIYLLVTMVILGNMIYILSGGILF